MAVGSAVPEAPWLWIIGGPNGAGKTTFCLDFLPKLARTYDYINADLIAAGLSPLDPSRVPLAAGRIMLQRTEELLAARRSFAVESTLAGKTFLDLARRAKKKGWKVGVVYLWLANDQIALQRVANRVKQGGHDIPKETVKRRRRRGLEGLGRYLDLADRWAIFDNSDTRHRPMASYDKGQMVVDDPDRFRKLREP